MTTIIILFSFGARMKTENPHMFFTNEKRFLEYSNTKFVTRLTAIRHSSLLVITFSYKPNSNKWLETFHDHQIQPYAYFNAMTIVHIVMQAF